MGTKLTQERLKELLHYDPETGVFTRLVDAAGGKYKAGERAGSAQRMTGYRMIGVDGTAYPECHLVWLYVHGELPPTFLYTVNGDFSDNRLSNLRLGVNVTGVELTQDILKKISWYDPEIGGLFVVQPTGKKSKPGTPLSSDGASGYLAASIGAKRYLEHRLVWLWHHGGWPTKHLDHINCNRQDNRIENLRECDDAENGQNRARLNRNNTIGFQGVCWDHRYGTYSARICSKGKQTHLGTFGSAEAAFEAYKEAKARIHTFNPEAPTPREATCAI